MLSYNHAKKLLAPLFCLITLAVLLTAPFCLAANLQDATPNISASAGAAGLQTSGDLTAMAASIVKALLGFIGIVFVVLIIYGGFLWMTSAGNEQKTAKAKKLILNAVIGLAIIIVAYSIAYFIADSLKLQTGQIQ